MNTKIRETLRLEERERVRTEHESCGYTYFGEGIFRPRSQGFFIYKSLLGQGVDVKDIILGYIPIGVSKFDIFYKVI